ncbi:MAG TPA: hypothetical protein VGK74_09445 [Symbiobacteriaceae bacterium]|jgi:hypothetical protein
MTKSLGMNMTAWICETRTTAHPGLLDPQQPATFLMPSDANDRSHPPDHQVVGVRKQGAGRTGTLPLFGKLREHIPLLENQGDYASSILLRHILKEEEDIARKLALYIQHEGLAHTLIHQETKKP